ncbi:MAG: hypothetical protein OSB29_06280 [Verrucomicrobiota bacterium]|nr:hypothetical protein [Verrucomicrobiota bacterium]
MWKSGVYISVADKLPGADNVQLRERFLSRVSEGHPRHGEKNETLKRQLFYYTTCSKCAKAYGENYVVLLAEV